jgi:hypothetical protein
MHLNERTLMLDANHFKCGELPLRVITKGEYVLNCLLNRKTKDDIEERWNKISKGYNFVLGRDTNHVYSVDFINESLEDK